MADGGPGLLATIDWVVIGVYVGGLVVLGLAVSRRHLGPADYFLASRATQWPAIGLAMLASNMSSTALVGLAGGAYAIGIAVYDYEWTATVILVFFCVFLLPFVIRSQTFTMPEFLERRYDRRVRVQFALMSLFLIIFVDAAGVLYSGALVCRLLFPVWPLWLIVAVLAAAAGLYTTLGGLRAVIYTEAVQAIVLLAGALMISISAFHRAGGWHAVMTGVNPAAISLIRPIGDAGVPWPGLLFGIPLWGALFAGLLKLPILFLIVLPGTCALLLFPHLPRADTVYPMLILRLLPAGLIGLVAAGFIASTMVSIASMLNSASTLITMDVVRQLNPSLSDRRIVKVGQWCTVALLAAAVSWAPQLQLFPSLWQYLQAVLAYVVPPVVALFLCGMFWRAATANAASATMLIGSLCGLALFLSNVVFGWTHIHFLYAAPLLTALDVAILATVSAFEPVSGSHESTMWQTRFGRAENPRVVAFWQDYRFLAAGLLALTAAIVIIFR